MASYKITLSQANWTDGTAEFWYDDVTQGFYADSDLTEEISSIAIPSRELYRFEGFFASNGAGAAQYIDSDGGFTSELYDLAIKDFLADSAPEHDLIMMHNLENSIDELTKEAQNNHVNRLRAKECNTETGVWDFVTVATVG